MRRVVWSADAGIEYRNIITYIARTNPQAAQTVGGKIRDSIESLAAMPTGRKGRVTGTYEKSVHGLPYIIAYALGDEPKNHETLTILRVIHDARDWREDSWPE